MDAKLLFDMIAEQLIPIISLCTLYIKTRTCLLAIRNMNKYE